MAGETIITVVGKNVAESLTKGTRVIVTGRLRQRSYETREGEKRTVIELEVDEIGPSLKYATAKVNKMTRSRNFGDDDWNNASSQRPPAGGSADDPWASAAPAGQRAAGGSFDEEPPF
jgi:single-strand DNA-binding protein